MHDDEVIGCLLQAITTMTVPESALRLRSSRPFSGGEHMKSERRGPIGSSESENPLAWAVVFFVEEVGLTVIIEVGVGIIAAIGTLVETKKRNDECLDKYEACTDSPLGKLQVDIWGTSVCESCRLICVRDGAWPLGFKPTGRWQTCL